MSEVIIAVVSFNGLQETKKCVWSLRDQISAVDIVIWDNASTDGTVEWISQNLDLFYGVCLSPKNVMWTPAVNSALQTHLEDRHSYVGWMNNDIIVTQPDVVEHLVGHLQSVQCGVIAPMMPRVGGPQENNQYIGMPVPSEGWMIAPYVLGAFCLMRREVWVDVGPLDETMPLGADDHDYSIRIREAGYQCRVARDVWVDHGGHASAKTDEGARNWDEWGDKSWNSFNEKWSNYYFNEEEAIKCHWGGQHHPGWDIGTGWLPQEERDKIFAIRQS